MRSLPPASRLWDALELGDLVRWTLDREIAWTQAELLDMIARKGTKRRKTPLLKRSLRPKRKRRPVSMSDPEALSFFGARKTGPPPPAP